ncbi:DNA topoisomerase 2 [Coemansia erecta]|nr:DNA topoisomerase 2 [Coemansia erecta]
MAEKLGRDLQIADNRVRFVLEIIQKKLVVSNRKRKELVKDLKDRKYTPIPKKVRQAVAGDPDAEKAAEAEAEEQEQEGSDYDYLLSMPIWNLTMEKVEKLMKEKKDIEVRLEDLLSRTPVEIWEEDLEEVERLWNEMVLEYQQRLQADEENRNKQKGGKVRGKGKGKAAAPRAKATSTAAAAATAASAAKRKPDAMDLESKSKPAAKVQKTLGYGGVGKPAAKVKEESDVKPKLEPPAVAPSAINLGSDLDDSDDDVTTNIFSKFKIGGGGGRSVLGSKMANAPAKSTSPKLTPSPRGGMPSKASSSAGSSAVTKTAKPPAPAKKRITKKTVIDSDDDDDSDGGGFMDSDSAGGGGSPPPKRSAPLRKRNVASSAKTSAYVDVSDDSDDGDFEMDD